MTAPKEAQSLDLRNLLAETARYIPDPSEIWNVGERGRVEALRSRVAAAIATPEPSNGWRDIASAPSNLAILIRVPKLDYYGNQGVYAGMLVDMGTGRRWMTFGWAMGRDLGPDSEPTHWMPLPTPPAGASQ